MSDIDWSMMVTAEMKEAAAAAALLEQVQAEIAGLRKVADDAIAPLQDAVDIDEATTDEEARLKLWKKYRVALSRVPEQGGYPEIIDWPAPPTD
ncbi:tail fiber assembly protein [Pseudomonas sp. M2]|uniref:tail fiber assembly protein n=1 Tax=unclassified Pseudomonas TaxID=196821 RepID=UPI0018CB5571|nr:tail fiber assembly protein [Pseudomonas sp. M2]MBG6127405.1 signal transduction histidine kinase [Pseudomonas sp. M2]HDS1746480.1 tail fiber assembly protein [Pseudomonas putida]